MIDTTALNIAILNPQVSMIPPHLKKGKPTKKNLAGLEIPWSRSGAFASVFKVDVGGTNKAIRVFLTDVGQVMRDRYRCLDKCLKAKAAAFTVSFAYHEEGLVIRKAKYPIIEMDWVDGNTLIEETERLCVAKNAPALCKLAEHWAELVLQMDSIGMAHGSLSGDDVMVVRGNLILIDYDGVFFNEPVLRNNPPDERGNPRYQHRESQQCRAYNERMDDFSSLAIYVAILAIAEDLTLFKKYADPTEGKLLYEASDLADPDQSRLFADLRRLQTPAVRELVKRLNECCVKPIDLVPRFSEILPQSGAKMSSHFIQPHSRMPSMPYQMNMSATNPGLVIFLLDQSGSMEEEFQAESLARGQKLMDAVAAIVNKTIHKIGLSCVKGSTIRPRVDIAVIGYNGPQGVHSALPNLYGGNEIVSIAQLMEKNLRVDVRMKKEYSPETGEYQDIRVQFPIWVDPFGDGGTPMCGALTKATDLARSWIAAHQESFPPILLNLTDGAASDSDPQPAAEEFRRLCTNDGNALVFNCHICAFPSPDGVSYPESADRLPTGTHDSLVLAQVLFNMSSELPAPMFELAKAKVNPNMSTGARGFVFNADVSGIIDMITIATTLASAADTPPATSALPASDPNR